MANVLANYFSLVAPGIIGGALLAFTLSIDDFVITFLLLALDIQRCQCISSTALSSVLRQSLTLFQL